MRPFDFDTAQTIRAARRDRLARRVFIVLLAAFVGLGLFNVLGARRDDVVVTGLDGTRLRVDYPSVTRAALSAPLVWEVTRAGGFDDPVVLRITQSWLRIFDYNDVEPQPAATTYSAGSVEWKFDPPPSGDTLRIQLDGRIDPSSRGRHGAEAMVMDGERVLVRASYSTRVLP